MGPHGIPLCRTRRLGDGVALPDLLAGRNIQRDDTAAKGAALVGGRRPGGFLDRRNRHIQNAGIQGWRTGDHGRRMILHLRLPEQCARDRVHGVGIGAQIAKKHGKLVGTGDRGKTDRGSNDRLGLERPAGASAFCVKRVDLAVAATNKQQAADNGWLGIAEDLPGNPNAHFSRNGGTWSRVNPAIAAG